MTIISRRIYPEGETYSGSAIEEIIHSEFLKTYPITEAVNNIITSIERAAAEQGRSLLTIEIDYTSGLIYHIFDVRYNYHLSSQMSGYSSMIGPVAVAPLAIWAFRILAVLVGLYLVKSTLTEVKEIVYGPPGAEPSKIPSAILIGVILFGGAALIGALKGMRKEV